MNYFSLDFRENRSASKTIYDFSTIIYNSVDRDGYFDIQFYIFLL